MFSLFLFFFIESFATQKTDAVLTVLDIGQGQCVYYQADGFTVFVDCGGSSSNDAAQKAADYLRSSGETTVDFIVLTHYDADHAGGVPSLLDWLEVGTVVLPDMQPDNKYRLAIEEHAALNGTQLLYVTQDYKLQTGNLEIKLYAPYSAASSNDAGICILLTQNEFDVLITGDVSSDIEHRLIKYGDLPDIEILIAGHHGSKYSTGEELLTATTPEAVVISCGADNSYGHPHEETLARIAATGAALYRTDLQGDIVLTERQVANFGG